MSGKVLKNPFGLYLHIPFCEHRCSYCHFFTTTQYKKSTLQRYTQGLVQEIREGATFLKKQGWFDEVDSIFFGGGTPSLLPVDSFSAIQEALQSSFLIKQSVEVSMEANPETISKEFCDGLKKQGFINRISLGVQSFKPQFLKKLDRIGTQTQIFKAIKLLHNTGFKNINLDLMFGIPKQKISDLKQELQTIVKCHPTHVSCDNLTLPQSHVLSTYLPTDDHCAMLYQYLVNWLQERGYMQYEISNFSKPNFECIHNLIYWSGGNYLGFGPSAASCFFDANSHVFWRKKNTHSLSNYLSAEDHASIFDSTWTVNTPEETLTEGIFLELRKNSGIHLPTFEKKYQCRLVDRHLLDTLIKRDLLQKTKACLILTEKGRLLADSVVLELMDVYGFDSSRSYGAH